MRISHFAFTKFGIDYWVAKQNGSPLRFGQAFLNERFPDIADPDLFYEEDDGKAWEMILDKYVKPGYTGFVKEVGED